MDTDADRVQEVSTLKWAGPRGHRVHSPSFL